MLVLEQVGLHSSSCTLVAVMLQCLVLLLFKECNVLLKPWETEVWAAAGTVLWNLLCQQKAEEGEINMRRCEMVCGRFLPRPPVFRAECHACHGSLGAKTICSWFRLCCCCLVTHVTSLACQFRPNTMSVALRSHEVVVHEKLVFRLTKLRVSNCEAVLWEEFDKLSALAKAFANMNVTAAALAESGVRFLVADNSLWRLGDNTAVTNAEQAENV